MEKSFPAFLGEGVQHVLVMPVATLAIGNECQSGKNLELEGRGYLPFASECEFGGLQPVLLYVRRIYVISPQGEAEHVSGCV